MSLKKDQHLFCTADTADTADTAAAGMAGSLHQYAASYASARICPVTGMSFKGDVLDESPSTSHWHTSTWQSDMLPGHA
jgi:hypothetical protein